MAMKYKNYDDFVKTELKAVPVTIAQPQMVLGAVLELRRNMLLTPYFQRVGTLSSLCAANEHKEQIQTDLANLETLDQPFGRRKFHDFVQGYWKSESSGFLGGVVSNAAEVKAWVKAFKFVKFEVFDVTSEYLKDDYLVDIINNGKWKPNIESLKEFYTIQEIVFASEIKFRLSNGAGGGASAELNLPIPNLVPAGASANYSQNADGSISIRGVTENGQRQPFPIGFRAAHVKYNKNFKPKKLELGVIRGDKDHGSQLSVFVANNEKYHIGEFFLNNDDDDEDAEPTIVPINFDES